MSRAAAYLVFSQATIALAEKTTVIGNEAAKASITSLINTSTRLFNVLTQDGDDLQ
jgi:type VII secretion effector (TIGR04197 family)